MQGMVLQYLPSLKTGSNVSSLCFSELNFKTSSYGIETCIVLSYVPWKGFTILVKLLSCSNYWRGSQLRLLLTGRAGMQTGFHIHESKCVIE